MTVFSGSKFYQYADFKKTYFYAPVSFKGCRFNELDCMSATFNSNCNFSGNYNNDLSQTPIYDNANFSHTLFNGRPNFGNRIFNGKTNFNNAKFEKAPLFHNSELHQDTSFENASFPSSHSYDETDSRAYNTLRLAINKQQFVWAEKKFIRLQLDSERAMSKFPENLLYLLYKKFSDYGHSILKPISLLLIAPIILFAIFYGLIRSSEICNINKFYNCYIDYPLLVSSFKFSFIQSMPPLGIEQLSESIREPFFKNPDYRLILLTVTQKFISLIGWFLIVLGIRNIYKLK